MLTWDQLEALCGAGVLVRWPARAPTPGFQPRFLYLDAHVYDQIENGPWPDAEDESAARTRQRRYAMRSVLTRFSRGEGLNINRDLKELGTRDVDVSMQGFWEFKSQGPMHETRLFGFFARPAAFVGLRFGSRKDMNDADFATRHAECRSDWAGLVGSELPISQPWPVRLRGELLAYTDE